MNATAEDRNFWLLAAVGGVVTAIGLAAAHYMELHGHIVTGMNNQVVWGLPHVFAIFMIVAASGVLNVASVGSVFGQSAYKPHAPLSGLLCLALLAGGLMVLMLDLGRPERIIVAATHYNFKSVFAWNIFLYSGMAGSRRGLPVDDVRAPLQRLRQAGRRRRADLALRADHRHRLDLRLSRRAPGLPCRRCWRRCSSCCR